MPRHPRLLALLLLLASLLAAAPAGAASPIGGDHDPPTTTADNLFLGFPEIGWQHDFATDGRRTSSLRAGLLVWPLSATVAFQHRRTALTEGKVTVSGSVGPLLYVGFFGGSRAFYADTRWGRSRSFLPSLGPGIDVGLQASARVHEKVDLTFSWTNPVVFWAFLIRPFQWYVEWPIVLAAGVQVRAGEQATFFGRLGAGPSIVISGATQQVGFYLSGQIGVHLAH